MSMDKTVILLVVWWPQMWAGWDHLASPTEKASHRMW